MVDLLKRIYKAQLISPESRDYLLGVMAKCQTGKNRMKWLLPAGTPVEHKTGTLDGLADDVGFITMPDGHRIAVAIFARGGSNRPHSDRRGGARRSTTASRRCSAGRSGPALTTANRVLLHIVARGKIGRSPEADLVERYLKRIAWPTKVTELPERGGKAPEPGAGAVTVVLDERGEALVLGAAGRRRSSAGATAESARRGS